jgi:hypothetical protein
MPKLPDALGTPDPNGFSPTDAAAQAGSGSAPDPAQSYDAISSVLDGASSPYSRFGQGGPPPLPKANSTNDLYGVPYNAGAASGYGYVGNAPLGRATPPGSSNQANQQQNATPQGTGNLTVSQTTTPPAPDQSAAPSTPPPETPISVYLNDGTQVQNPVTGGPLMQPAGVSLVRNARIGESLSLMPSAFSGGDAYREGSMAGLFLPGAPMDYQRVYGSHGLINKTFIAFGNYNYGAVAAAAAGYTLDQALRAAGTANLLGSGDKSDRYYNNPRNVPLIKAGFEAYQAGLIGKPARRE